MTATLEDEVGTEYGIYSDEQLVTVPEPAEPDNEPADRAMATIMVPQHVVQIVNEAPDGQNILSTCIDLAVFLAQKNISYGNSYKNPIRVFSKADKMEQLRVRIDDKLNRIMHQQEYGDDNDIRDLLGYLLLYFAAQVDNE